MKSDSYSSWPLLTYWAFLLVYLLLIYPLFIPAFNQLNLFDECYYLITGWLVWQNQIPAMSGNPLVGFLYSILYLPFDDSALWMLWTCRAGRILFAILLSLATFNLYRVSRPYTTPWLILLIFISFPILQTLLANPSDALFAGFSTLALSLFITAMNKRNPGTLNKYGLSQIIAASSVLALAALSRLDGIILFSIFTVLTILLFRKSFMAYSLAALLPFLSIMAIYFASYSLIMGDAPHGVKQRSYIAFEQGEGMAIQDRLAGKNPNLEGEIRSRLLYGTGEENDYSILKAIGSNPVAYAKRLYHTARRLPKQILFAYGYPFSILLPLLSAFGLMHLYRVDRTLALILILWPLHLFTYFLTFFREGYFLLAFGPVVLLGGIGADAVVRWFREKNLSYFSGIVYMLFAVILIYTVLTTHRTYAGRSHSYEEAIVFLTEQYPAYSRLGTYSPGPAWAAKMEPVFLNSLLLPEHTSEALLQWYQDSNLSAILLDPLAFQYEPLFCEFLLSQTPQVVEIQNQISDQCLILTVASSALEK